MTKLGRLNDGTYHWIYELNLFRTSLIFLLVWKIFACIVGAAWVVSVLASLGMDDFFWRGFLENARGFAIAFAVMTVVVAMGYCLYAAVMGGKYTVAFEMDEKGVLHRQIDAQAKKAKKLGLLAAALGAASGRFTAAGAGLMATRTEMYTEFRRVRRVKAYPRRNLIKVNGLLSRNQVYAEPEAFPFVLDFILRHVPETAKKPRGILPPETAGES